VSLGQSLGAPGCDCLFVDHPVWESVRSVRSCAFDLLPGLSCLELVHSLLFLTGFIFGYVAQQHHLAKGQSRPAFFVEQVYLLRKYIFIARNGGLFTHSEPNTWILGSCSWSCYCAMIIFLVSHRDNRPVWFSGLSIISLAATRPAAYSLGELFFHVLLAGHSWKCIVLPCRLIG
jgi:hypothetical protein